MIYLKYFITSNYLFHFIIHAMIMRIFSYFFLNNYLRGVLINVHKDSLRHIIKKNK